MAARDWSSLPEGLVNRVADCLLATNDLDCYTDLRAVCRHWRSSTDDPRSKNNKHDPRFRPSRWVMLDERKVSSNTITDTDTDGPFLFVNTATGRFLCRRLALLHDPGHAFVTSTGDGLLVLVGRDPPRTVSVLNPFTGSLIRFAAQLPAGNRWYAEFSHFTADVVGSSASSPTLVLFSHRPWSVHWADPRSESFSLSIDLDKEFPESRVPQIIAAAGQRAADERDDAHAPVAHNIFDQVRSFYYEEEDCRCYVVEVAGGDILAVKSRYSGTEFRGMDVFRIDAAGNVMERVKSIGNQALFLGVRSLLVDADCFPNVGRV